MKKILALVLAGIMLLSAVSCVKTGTEGDTTAADTGASTPKEYVDPYKDITDYDELSAAIYEDVLGEFYTAYEAAKAATTLSERWALMAIAEAKLMETALFLPLTSNGGNYAISKVVPNTITSALWGNDSYRYHNALVATTPLTSAHRDEIKAAWAEKKGTGTFDAWVKAYLADKGYALKDTYTLSYSSDPQTWDVLATSRAADSEAIVNTYDGLYEYDAENRLMPALAESYTKGTDANGKTTYTFKIRAGQVWVDAQGNKVADVKADDFVAGMQHMMDAMGGLEYLVEGIIVNATEYIYGDITDFSQVGVKAVDDTTLVYTLEYDCSFFMTMLGYGVFAPMSRSYYVSKGGQFGADYNPEDENYTYGLSPDTIAYCGPYTVTANTPESSIVFSANNSYWNKDNISIKTIKWMYNDGQVITKAYDDFKAGVLDGCGLNPSTLTIAKSEGTYANNIYVSATDATSFGAFFNVNRAIYANKNDDTKAISPKAENTAEQTRSIAALRNVHFRRALSFALDRGAYNAQTVGDDLKLTSLRNTYTPGTFVCLEEQVTVKINGTDKTYPAGTYYGKIMQDQIDADGVKIKVWDPQADGGIGSSDGFDGWYNTANAVEELNKAIAELAEQGIVISAEKPIYVDLPSYTGHESYKNRGLSLKASIEKALGGKVIINLVDCPKSIEWYNAGYYTNAGSEANYDIYDVSGWGPDYGDPQTYLDTFLPDYAGYMVKCIGIF